MPKMGDAERLTSVDIAPSLSFLDTQKAVVGKETEFSVEVVDPFGKFAGDFEPSVAVVENAVSLNCEYDMPSKKLTITATALEPGSHIISFSIGELTGRFVVEASYDGIELESGKEVSIPLAHLLGDAAKGLDLSKFVFMACTSSPSEEFPGSVDIELSDDGSGIIINPTTPGLVVFQIMFTPGFDGTSVKHIKSDSIRIKVKDRRR